MFLRFSFLALPLACLAASPATAQLFWANPDVTGAPLVGYETGMGSPLPGATPAEQKAAITWNMRSGLNVAALQCGFEPTLRTLENYNAILTNHNAELTAAFTTLSNYFKRTSKTVKAGQTELDRFGTRTYSGFSTVLAQLNFCTTAGRIGRRGLFTPRGYFGIFASEHLRELRNGLKFAGEQQFRFYPLTTSGVMLPSFDDKCWKKAKYQQKCGFTYLKG